MGRTSMIDHRKPYEKSMNEKILNIVEGEGLTLTPAEAWSFKLMLGAMHQRQFFADEQLLAIRDVHSRNGVEVVRFKHDDGSVSYSLQPTAYSL